MSDRPISKGDLVMVVRGHSCLVKIIGGMPFTVTDFIMPQGGGWRCPVCYMLNAGPNEPTALGLHDGKHGAPISYLKRIDPSALSEDVPADDEVTV